MYIPSYVYYSTFFYLYSLWIILSLQTIEDLEERVKRAKVEIAVRTSFLTDPTNAVRNLKVGWVMRSHNAMTMK